MIKKGECDFLKKSYNVQMNEIVKFVENYYYNNLTFDQKGFLSIIDVLFKEVEFISDAIALNAALTKMMNSFQFGDYYLVMQIIEYELIPYFISTNMD